MQYFFFALRLDKANSAKQNESKKKREREREEIDEYFLCQNGLWASPLSAPI